MLKEQGSFNLGQNTGHKGPVLRRARTHILFYSALFYSMLFCSILFYSILFYSILFYSILFCSILFCSILFCFVPFCSFLFYSILFRSILFYSILLYSKILLVSHTGWLNFVVLSVCSKCAYPVLSVDVFNSSGLLYTASVLLTVIGDVLWLLDTYARSTEYG